MQSRQICRCAPVALLGLFICLSGRSVVAAEALSTDPAAERFVVVLTTPDLPAVAEPHFDSCACGRDGAMMILTADELARLSVPHRVIAPLADYVRRFAPRRTMQAVGVPSVSKLLGEPVEVIPGGAAAGTSLHLDYSRYHSPQEGIDFIQSLAAARPDICQLMTIGASVEQRPIFALKITDLPEQAESNERAVFFCGVHHAREWATHEAMLYLTENLVTRYDTDAFVAHLVDHAEIWLVPVANPDGFDYSWEVERFWRKNRRLNFITPDDVYIYGVDLNRNYDYNWGPGFGGSSGNMGAETYRGPSAASEPETQAIQSLLASELPTIAVSFHTYSQLVLLPWGYSGSVTAQSYSVHRAVGEEYARRTREAHGSVFLPGPSNYTIYATNGDFTDYAYGAQGSIALTPELQPASAEEGGFLLPEARILPNNQEAWASATALINHVTNWRWIEPPSAPWLQPGENFFSLPWAAINQKPELSLGMDASALGGLYAWINDVAHVFNEGFYLFGEFTHVGASAAYRFDHTSATAPWADSFTGYEALPYVFDHGSATMIQCVFAPATNYLGVPGDRPIRLRDLRIIKRVMEGAGTTWGYRENVLESRSAIEDLESSNPWIAWRWTYTPPMGAIEVAHPLGEDGASEVLLPWRSYQFTSYVSSWAFGSEQEPVYLLVFPEPVRADLSEDGVVDLHDHDWFVDVLNGPIPGPLGELGAAADFDHDLDVDLRDVRFLQRQFGLTTN